MSQDVQSGNKNANLLKRQVCMPRVNIYADLPWRFLLTTLDNQFNCVVDVEVDLCILKFPYPIKQIRVFVDDGICWRWHIF